MESQQRRSKNLKNYADSYLQQKHETVYQINKKDYLFGKYVTNTGETAELWQN